MKVFDSGIPEETYWNSLFDIPPIIEWLDLESLTGPIAEIGCGYGTFTVPVAKWTSRPVHAIDIDPEMIRIASERCAAAAVRNVAFHCYDVLDSGTGLPSDSMGMVLLINILHSPDRTLILKEASRIVRRKGRVAVIHWRKDIPTPRGPSVESRPDLPLILELVAGLDLGQCGGERILEPFHWGVQLIKGDGKRGAGD